MKGRLSKKGAERLDVPHLAGKVVDYGDESQFKTVSVSYRGNYLGFISVREITPVATRKKKVTLFKKLFG